MFVSKNNKKILIIGAGPIVIGQGCEFDYSGTQACRALRECGYSVILINSNPATIMTDPEIADVTYIEPITVSVIEQIIVKEKPDMLLPTMGGQTALNCALALAEAGILNKHKVELIGASTEVIARAENRDYFNQAMREINLNVTPSYVVKSCDDIKQHLNSLTFPIIIRSSFTLGGAGGGIAYQPDELLELAQRALELSPIHEALIEQSVIGWKEYEMEVIRDKADNCIIVCAIENIDPMGVHTGDSITIAPIQTLTDKEYQAMRAAAMAVVRKIGVIGAANVQFAVNPDNGDMLVIEMNPRVSRSSALASKATGYPIAKVSAKLAVGFTLQEIKHDLIGLNISAAFEPVIDYVVTKIPRFNFDKFPGSHRQLAMQMKSVGEAMAIGRTFQESLQKAIVSLEEGHNGLDQQSHLTMDELDSILRQKHSKSFLYIAEAFRRGKSINEIYQLTHVDKWFLHQIQELVICEQEFCELDSSELTADVLEFYKRKGFTDKRLADLHSISEAEIKAKRQSHDVHPVFKRVDTCAAEFPASSYYLYSTYEEECEALPTTKKKVVIIGSGPNRIGQGIEFDYCCVHAAWAVKELGYESIIINCNPSTVSTDYDISSRLYFEPITLEHVTSILEVEQPDGVIVQCGGQAPLKLANELSRLGYNVLGTGVEAIDILEDRNKFRELLLSLHIPQPTNAVPKNDVEAMDIASTMGYPLVARPSYVLGGANMKIVENEKELADYLKGVTIENDGKGILLERFLDNAVEFDVDAIADGQNVMIAGIMRQVEFAGIHSGDSASLLGKDECISVAMKNKIHQYLLAIVQKLHVKGFINMQLALHYDTLYVIEVNPRASRTIPFVSKTYGLPLVRMAVECMLGQAVVQSKEEKQKEIYAAKCPVFSFDKLPGARYFLDIQMKSTGEVMGIADTADVAYYKASAASKRMFARAEKVFLSDNSSNSRQALIDRLVERGLQIFQGETNSLGGEKVDYVLSLGDLEKADLLRAFAEKNHSLYFDCVEKFMQYLDYACRSVPTIKSLQELHA